MSFSDEQLVSKIATSGDSEGAPIGWEATVFRTIRDERAQKKLAAASQKNSVGTRPSRFSALAWPVSGFALAVAMALVFFGVREQARTSKFAERRATISMVMEYVGLETRMTRQLADIDLEEARMDEAFHELRLAKSTALLPESSDFVGLDEAPFDHASKRHVQPRRKANVRKVKSDLCSSSPNSPSSLCGL